MQAKKRICPDCCHASGRNQNHSAKKCARCQGKGFLKVIPEAHKPDAEDLEQVQHPNHYGGKDNPYEAIKIIESYDKDFLFHRGNVIKYVMRAGKKDDTVQDLEKAAWYLNRMIEGVKKK